LHREDICHFDLKPANILVQEERNGELSPKISDFGMASKRTEDGKWGSPGFTLGYSSPEQLQNYQIGPHCDVWGFAMTAYYVICRKGPYDYLNIQGERNPKKRMYVKELCTKLRKPLLPADFSNNYPQLAYLLQQCWHSNPTSRPTMIDVLKKLQKLAA
jgi:serine/threonine protein kinase